MPADSHVGTDVFDRILSASGPLVALQAGDTHQLIDQFRLVARRTGQAVYLWRHAEGLASLRDAQMRVPGCTRLGDALRYISQSLHFGVYLFVDFAGYIKPADTLLLRRISRLQTANERKLVFVGSNIEMPEELDGMYDRMSVQTEQANRLRLRDGRWVQ